MTRIVALVSCYLQALPRRTTRTRRGSPNDHMHASPRSSVDGTEDQTRSLYRGCGAEQAAQLQPGLAESKQSLRSTCLSLLLRFQHLLRIRSRVLQRRGLLSSLWNGMKSGGRSTGCRARNERTAQDVEFHHLLHQRAGVAQVLLPNSRSPRARSARTLNRWQLKTSWLIHSVTKIHGSRAAPENEIRY